MGPSGSGTTTLGQALSSKLSIFHEDSDRLFWENTDPPFTTRREIHNLHRLFYTLMNKRSFILSGDVLNWGLPKEDLLHQFSHVIYLYVPWEIREKRIREREFQRFGDRIKKNGDMHQTHEDFISWASKYESVGQVGRNQLSQKNFINHFLQINKNVLRVESPYPINQVIDMSLLFLNNK